MSTEAKQKSYCSSRESVVENIWSLIARFPEHELDIRRRYTRDAHFRSVCADYEEASTALAYWKKIAKGGDRKLTEYANLLGELEVEILAQLDHHDPE